MFKNKRTLFLTAILAIFMCAISFVVFAAFETSQTYDSTASTHQISNKVVTGPSEATEINLSSDVKSDTTYTLSNADAMNYVYSYTLSVSNVSDVNLLNSIFVYADDVFVGTLADYTTAKDLGLKKIIFEGTQDTPSIENTKISYQLHNSTLENFTANITLTCIIQTPDIVNYYFVSNETDLKYAIDDVNVLSFTSDIPTIVLTSDITTTTEYTISDSCIIDLCGNDFILGSNISIESDVHILDSKGSGMILDVDGNILLPDEPETPEQPEEPVEPEVPEGEEPEIPENPDDSGEVIEPEEPVTRERVDSLYKLIVNGDNALLTSDITIDDRMYLIQSISEAKLADYLKAELDEYKHFVSGTPYDVFGFEAVYFGAFASLSVEGVAVEDVTQMVITSTTTNEIQEMQIVVGEEERALEMLVYGDDEAALLSEILSNDLAHLVQFDNDDTYEKFSYDLYLPTIIKRYNATISWWSSNEAVLSNDGKLHDFQGNVELVATIKIFDTVYTYTYRLRGSKQDDMDKLLYLASKLEPLLRLTGTNKPVYLPTSDNYLEFFANKDIEIEDIELEELAYYLEPTYYYINYNPIYGNQISNIDSSVHKINDATIALVQPTFQKNARIQIQAKFAGNDEVITTHVKISIQLAAEDVADQVFDYIQSYLYNVDVLQNILTSREEYGISNEKGDFELPNVYENYKFRFYVDLENKSLGSENDMFYLTADNYTTQIQTVKINLDRLNLVDTRAKLYAEIVVGEGESQSAAAVKEVFFMIPSAITSNNFPAFNTLRDSNDNLTDEGELFYNIKLQALQQSAPDALLDGNKLLTAATYEDVKALKEYILLYDIENTQELYFEFGRVNTVLNRYALEDFQSLLNWATDGIVQDIPATVKNQLNSKVHWIQSDNSEELSDEEIYVILHYAERFPAFESLVWGDYVDVYDNVLSDEDYNALLSVIIDQRYSKILDWVTSETGKEYEATEYLVEQLGSSPLPQSIGSNKNDNSSRITESEEEVLIYYVISTQSRDKFEAFYKVWINYIKRFDDAAINSAITFEKYDHSASATIIDCYDPIFAAMYRWMSFHEPVASSGETLSSWIEKLINDNDVYTNVFAPEIRETLFDYSYGSKGLIGGSAASANRTKDNEFNVLKHYVINCYGITEPFVIKSDSTTYGWSAEYAYSEVSGYTPLTYTKPDGSIITATAFGIAEGTGLLGNTTASGSYITDDFVNYIIELINAKWVDPIIAYERLYQWATSVSDTFDANSYLVGSVEQNYYDLSNYANNIKDGYSFDNAGTLNYRISYTEGEILIGILDSGFIKDASGNYSDELNVAFKQYVVDKMGVDITRIDQNFVLSAPQKTEIMETIEKHDEFNRIYQEIISFAGEKPHQGVNYDNLSTVSEKEFKYLLDFVLNNPDYADKVSGFIEVYNSVITTYGYDTTISDYVNNQNVDRDLSAEIDLLIGSVYELIGNKSRDEFYMYIPIDEITFVDESGITTNVNDTAFAVLKYFTVLTHISFKGNSLDSLFNTNSDANNLFSLICNSSDTLQSITFNYTRLSSIDGIQNLETIEYLDFRGNESGNDGDAKYDGISKLNPLLELLNAKIDAYGNNGQNHDHKLSYMNFYMTDVDFKEEEYKYVKLYLTYSSSSPEYYYNYNEEETKYILNVNDGEKVLVETLFLLSAFKDITFKHFYLPNRIYSTNNNYNNITWSHVSGAYNLTNNGGWRIERVASEGVYPAATNCIIAATISDNNGNSYTRYFNFDMLEYKE